MKNKNTCNRVLMTIQDNFFYINKMQCPKCNNELPAGAKFCNQCGTKIEEQGKTCPNPDCKRTGLPPEAVYCPECGWKLTGNFASFTETVNGVSFDMVAVEGGSFLMGSPPDEPGRYDNETQHRVTLSNYFVGKYPVTQELWQTVMGNNPNNFKGYNHPVERVSWNDCQVFLEKLNQLTGKNIVCPPKHNGSLLPGVVTIAKGTPMQGAITLMK